MELALIVSILSLCGFAAALCYNVYEFRKVGQRLDQLGRNMAEDHRMVVEALERMSSSMAEDHRRIVEVLEGIERRLSER